MIYVLLILFGLVLGSFINALIWRLHEQSEYYDEEGNEKKLSKADKKRLSELSIAKGRSMCSRCGHQLSVWDLIPMFSWVFLRGRCRYCSEKIDDTPLIELGLPILLVISYIFWPYSLQNEVGYGLLALWVFMMTCFVALAVYDAKWYLLPDRIVLPLTVLAVAFTVLRAYQAGEWTNLFEPFIAAAVLAGLFLAIYLTSRGEWIGFGDVKLAVSLGLIVGTPILAMLIVFVASVSGTVAALPQLVNGQKDIKRTIPFGPHLLIACMIVFLFGESMVEWYINLLMT